ncbi:hypothetical protein LTR02_016499 [Friedmanniomyces endolithicus]|nr:hypothetical protein LTR02_016499 [Friedmanniomyces endolithicus]
MSSPFNFEDSRSRHNIPDDETLSESDFEHLCPTDVGVKSEAVHSWYGKLMFTQRLAESIIREVEAGITVHELDMVLMRRMADFPYSARLAKVQCSAMPHGNHNKLSSASQSSFSRFVALIGILACRNDQRSKGDLAALMAGQDNEDTDSKARMYQYQPTSLGTRTSERIPLITPTTSSAASDIEIARYSTAWYEYGERTGHKPLYDIPCVTLNPPLFRATLCIEGQSFDDTAANKKLAKHLASQQACQSLGIRI